MLSLVGGDVSWVPSGSFVAEDVEAVVETVVDADVEAVGVAISERHAGMLTTVTVV
jgi:hypothetical protein